MRIYAFIAAGVGTLTALLALVMIRRMIPIYADLVTDLPQATQQLVGTGGWIVAAPLLLLAAISAILALIEKEKTACVLATLTLVTVTATLILVPLFLLIPFQSI